jgi:hypothetical protein
LIRLNHPYTCPCCPAVIVVLKGHGWDGYLPAEVINGTEINDREFDHEKHKSHLINCKKLQLQWNGIKKRIIDQEKKQSKLSLK